MKNLIKTIIVLLSFTFGCKVKNSQIYTIRGKIKGVSVGNVNLNRRNDDRTRTVLDSAVIKNGKFQIKGNLEIPEMLEIEITPGSLRVPIFMVNSSIRVSADTTDAAHFDYTAYGLEKGADIKKVQISGSEPHNDLISYDLHPENTRFKSDIKELNRAYRAEKSTEGKALFKSKFDTIGNMYKHWQLNWIKDYVNKKPGSPTGIYLFQKYYLTTASSINGIMPLSEMDSVLAMFKGVAKQTKYYQELVKLSDFRHNLTIGMTAPDFTLSQRDSTEFKLSSLRGKYVLIDFWASWCKPCRDAIPHWKEAYKRYKNQGFEILSISIDRKWTDWTNGLESLQMPWLNVIDQTLDKGAPGITNLYQVHFIPHYILLDKTGKILVNSGKDNDIDTKIREIFGD